MLLDYMLKAFGAWFMGFFPLAEIYVAVPAAAVAGLDDVSVLFWTIFGNLTPVFLILFMYEWLLSYERIKGWLDGMVSERAKGYVNRYGVWVVLLATPWIGVWIMSVTAKALKMDSRKFLIAASVSVVVYAVLVLMLVRTGMMIAGA